MADGHRAVISRRAETSAVCSFYHIMRFAKEDLGFVVQSELYSNYLDCTNITLQDMPVTNHVNTVTFTVISKIMQQVTDCIL